MRTCPQCQSYLLGSDRQCSYCKAELPPEPPALEATVPAAPVPVATVAVEASPGLATLESIFGETAKPEAAPRRAPEPEQKAPAPEATPVPVPQGAHQRWVPLVASAVLPGAGQLIKGQPVRGYVVLAAVAVMSWLGWTSMCIIAWALQAWDASQPKADAHFEDGLAAMRRQLHR